MTPGSFAFNSACKHTGAHNSTTVQGGFALICQTTQFLEGNGNNGAHILETKDCNSIMLAEVPAV